MNESTRGTKIHPPVFARTPGAFQALYQRLFPAVKSGVGVRWLTAGPTGELIDDQGSSLPIRVLVSYVTDPPLDLISSLIKRASAPIKLQSALYKSIRCKVTLALHRASKSKSTSKHLTNGQKAISKVTRCI